ADRSAAGLPLLRPVPETDGHLPQPGPAHGPRGRAPQRRLLASRARDRRARKQADGRRADLTGVPPEVRTILRETGMNLPFHADLILAHGTVLTVDPDDSQAE